ncbi:MAG: hypothetical protein L0H84_04590 [Pseudonocardia sp.]|nr:hypothetical protein [Pseudonocardia sp.]
MARIVFELEIEAPAKTVVTALDSQQGIASWWTDDVTFAGGVGSVMRLGFPVAPLPFELRVDKAGEESVRWASIGEFPPHWVGTTIAWTLTPRDGNNTVVHFSHDGWAGDDGPMPSAALTWGQLMLTLKQAAETGRRAPLFQGAG